MAGETRGRMGRIQGLPPEIKAYVDRRLREGATQAAVVEETGEMLAALDEPPLSRSGVNRYATRMEQVGRRIREAREAADAWTAKFGEAPSGAVGQHVVEILRTMAYDWTLAHGDEDIDGGPVDPETLNHMALAVRRLEQAAAVGDERERRMRREIAEKAAESVDRETRAAGSPLPPEALQRIREQVYGIYDD